MEVWPFVAARFARTPQSADPELGDVSSQEVMLSSDAEMDATQKTAVSGALVVSLFFFICEIKFCSSTRSGFCRGSDFATSIDSN